MDFINLPIKTNDESRLTLEEQTSYLTDLPNWQKIEVDGVNMLTKTFTFKTYRDAWLFVNQVSAFAEEVGHHPSVTLSWGKSTVTWWTHDLNGIGLNDFICAANTDLLNQQL